MTSSKWAHDRIVLLDCRHKITFYPPAPQVGNEVYCYRCQGYRHVVVSDLMYRARCETQGCRFSRSYGVAKLTAEHKASRHVREHPGHSAVVLLGEDVVTRVGSNPGQESLLDLLDLPPF